MKKTLLTLVLLLVSLLPSSGKVITDSIQSNVLNATVKFNVWLPNGYKADGSTQYPVLYLLHGFSDTYQAWVHNGQVNVIADELMGTGEICPMVIIMPNAGGPDTRKTINGYFNMEGWAYEDFFYTEFIPTVERRYHIVGDKEHRAVSGLSMGGGGSTVYAQRHPDMFSSCYAMSPWLTEDAPAINPDDKGTYTRNAVHDHSAIVFLQNASDDVKNSLRTVRWFLDIGDDDFLLSQSFDFYEEMRRQFIPCELRVRNGIHNWEYWHNALRTSLPFASRNFKQ